MLMVMMHMALGMSCPGFELTDWKRPWCWARVRAGGEGEDRGWDGWMAPPTRWTWVWASSRRWWWTGRPGELQSMGSQRVRQDWATELTEHPARKWPPYTPHVSTSFWPSFSLKYQSKQRSLPTPLEVFQCLLSRSHLERTQVFKISMRESIKGLFFSIINELQKGFPHVRI